MSAQSPPCRAAATPPPSAYGLVRLPLAFSRVQSQNPRLDPRGQFATQHALLGVRLMKRTSLHTAIVAALAGCSAAATQSAWAQQQPAANEGLEEIVVTATRREQNLQDLPLAVVAYTG